MSFMIMPEILWITSLAALIASAATDLKERIIPNELVVAIALAGLLLCLLMRPGQLGISLLAAALVFLAMGVLCRYGAIAGGDVKLMAAVTLLVPPSGVVELLARIALAGGLLSSLYLSASYLIGSARGGSCDAVPENAVSGVAAWARLESARIASRKQVPYAVAILGGVIWYFARERVPCSAMPCLF